MCQTNLLDHFGSYKDSRLYLQSKTSCKSYIVDNEAIVWFLFSMGNDHTSKTEPMRDNISPDIKLGVAELALLGWLAGAPDKRFAVVSGKNVQKLYERLEPREDGLHPVRSHAEWDKGDSVLTEMKTWFGGKISWDTRPLEEAGLVNSYARMAKNFGDKDREFDKSVADVYIPGQWNLDAHYVSVAGVTAVTWWAAYGRERHSKLLDAIGGRIAKMEVAKRQAVFGKEMGLERKLPERIADLLPQGFNFPLPRQNVIRPICTAVVTRETATRLYVEDVKAMSGAPFWPSMIVNKHGGEQYIDRQMLILDNASPADVASIASFDTDRNRDHIERCSRFAEEMLPVIQRMLDLDKQNAVEHDESFRELLASLKKD